MYPLKKIEVQGFKSIREAKVKLGPLNILIGPNGAGKSNFISLFKLLDQIVSKNLQAYIGQSGGASKFLFLGPKVTSEINISFDFDPNGYACKLGPTGEDSFIFLEEIASFRGNKPTGEKYENPYTDSLGAGHKESKMPSKNSRIAGFVFANIVNWRVYHFHDTSVSSKMKLIGDLNDNEIFKPDAANLAAFLYFLREKHDDYYRNIVDTIKLVAPFFDDFILRPSKLNKNKIQLEWKQKGSEDYFDANSLSDGTLRFICLTTLLLQPDLPSLLLLDEPELGLHPYAITLLASLLKSTSTKTQVIVSTQSVTLVNQFDPENIIVVDREDGQSTFKKLKKDEMDDWLEHYGLGDLWEKNILGGRPS
jgi:predicted ATPase